MKIRVKLWTNLKIMRTKFTSFLLIINFLFIGFARADEGLWIPLLLNKYTIEDMQKKGFKLTAEDLYSINHASLKDAVMIFGGGCTAELISDNGLLITNYHCGYSSIQQHSSLEHDYLTNGFAAYSHKDELSNPNLTVTFLSRMEDVSAQVLKNVNNNMSEKDRQAIINDVSNTLIKQNSENGKYKVTVIPFFAGNQYFMFVQKVYRDVRLVLAPPSAIGKFGGDTDNWMWPRHTGDFSIFRIYADKNNEPADYSDQNIPYKPLKALTINPKGFKAGDFTMVFGYPGRTQEYITSYAVKGITQVVNPAQISLRQKRIDIMSRYMNQSKLVRIQYSAKYARVSNYWKKWIGENRGLKHLNAIAKKEAIEKEFQAWAEKNTQHPEYAKLLPDYKKVYKKLMPMNLSLTYDMEGALSIEIIRFARDFGNLFDLKYQNHLAPIKKRLKKATIHFFKNYYEPIDKEIFVAVMQQYAQNMPKEYLPQVFIDAQKKHKGNYQKWADDVYKKSLFTHKDKLLAFLDTYTNKKAKKLQSDPVYHIFSSVLDVYEQKIDKPFSQESAKIDSLDRIWIRALMEFEPQKHFYADANFTLRVSYGKIEGSYPRDGIKYVPQTYLSGVIEKDNPDIYDYRVPAKLKELYEKKDFGRWGENGKMPVCFLATNHTTGGNSGSPVLDAYGNLIGVNFDRSWESTMSDIMFDPIQCRNITLDIRYALFLIDKYFGAENIIKEIKIKKN